MYNAAAKTSFCPQIAHQEAVSLLNKLIINFITMNTTAQTVPMPMLYEQTVSNFATICIESLLVVFGFSWQLYNTFKAYQISILKKSMFNSILLYSQALYSLVFVAEGLKMWAINNNGGSYVLYFTRGAVPTDDPQYQQVLLFAKLETVLFLTSTFVYTCCVQFRLKSMKNLLKYCEIQELIMNTLTVTLYLAGIYFTFFMYNELGSPILHGLLFLWFAFVIVVEQVSCRMIFSQLCKVMLFLSSFVSNRS
jgi:hypothetical protein